MAERLVVRGYDRPVTVSDLPYEVRPARTLVASASRVPRAQLFDCLVTGGECFWTAVYDPFLARDVTSG